jgi:hypothetical protein
MGTVAKPTTEDKLQALLVLLHAHLGDGGGWMPKCEVERLFLSHYVYTLHFPRAKAGVWFDSTLRLGRRRGLLSLRRGGWKLNPLLSIYWYGLTDDGVRQAKGA